jgi:hypothetical protein
MSAILDIAQRIAVNAAAALDDIRNGQDGDDFPSHLFDQIKRDIGILNDIRWHGSSERRYGIKIAEASATLDGQDDLGMAARIALKGNVK